MVRTALATVDQTPKTSSHVMRMLTGHVPFVTSKTAVSRGGGLRRMLSLLKSR